MNKLPPYFHSIKKRGSFRRKVTCVTPKITSFQPKNRPSFKHVGVRSYQACHARPTPRPPPPATLTVAMCRDAPHRPPWLALRDRARLLAAERRAARHAARPVRRACAPCSPPSPLPLPTRRRWPQRSSAALARRAGCSAPLLALRHSDCCLHAACTALPGSPVERCAAPSWICRHVARFVQVPRLGRIERSSTIAHNAPVPMCTRRTRAAAAQGLLASRRSHHARASKRALLQPGVPSQLLHALIQRASRTTGGAAATTNPAQRCQPSAACTAPRERCAGCAAAV
jgi:hypothetical protein